MNESINYNLRALQVIIRLIIILLWAKYSRRAGHACQFDLQLIMFCNPKAQKIYLQNKQQNQLELNNIDKRLQSLHGNSYQQSLYTDFQSESICFVSFGFDKQFSSIYGIYGWAIEQEQINLVRLNLIKIVEEQIINKNQLPRGVSIIYFSQFEPISNNSKKEKKKKVKHIDFTIFKNQIIKNLQIKYLKCIKKIFVCHENIFSKSISILPFSKFGLHNQLIQSLIKYSDKLQNLVQDLGPLFECQLIKQQVQQYNSSIQWLQIYSNHDKKLAKRKMIEQIGEVQDKTKFYKLKLSEYELQYETGIPVVLNSLLNYLQRNREYLESEGIFRKTCYHQQLAKLENELVGCCLQQQITKILCKFDADTIACCIKAIFNKLNPPIISFNFYDEIICKMNAMYDDKENLVDKKLHYDQNNEIAIGQSQSKVIVNEDKKLQLEQQRIEQLIAYISYHIGSKQKTILFRLIEFFKEFIIANEKRNKMGAYNLSVVMGPCIFRPKKYSIQDLVNSPRLANLLFHMIVDPKKLQ